MTASKAADRAAIQHRAKVRITVADARANPIPVTAATPRFIREPELRMNLLGGIGATTLRRLIVEQGFPLGVHFSERIVAWDLHRVNAWIDSRPQAAELKPPPAVDKKGSQRRDAR